MNHLSRGIAVDAVGKMQCKVVFPSKKTHTNEFDDDDGGDAVDFLQDNAPRF